MPLGVADELHLRRAIALAAAARDRGNHPFGALLVDGAGAVLHEAENTVVSEREVTGHAELNLVRLAGRHHAPDELRGCTLYTSTEPCAMCAAAIFWSGVGRVVYALGADTLGEVAGNEWLLRLSCREVLERGSHPVEVSGPHLLGEARAVHAGFWK